MIVSGTLWLLVRVRFLTVAVFNTTVPKFNAAGDSVTAVIPAPVKLTTCGLVPASSVMVSVLAGVTPKEVGL